MCQRSIFARSCVRIAEEVQLEAEEEWILETLKNIKQQRNCLQIERLHLESLKVQLKSPAKSESDKEQPSDQELSKASTHPLKRIMDISAVDLMTMSNRQKDDLAINNDTLCNNQELNLNLNIPSSCFSAANPQYARHDYASDEESSSDGSDGENLKIDMNMFMNGT